MIRKFDENMKPATTRQLSGHLLKLARSVTVPAGSDMGGRFAVYIDHLLGTPNDISRKECELWAKENKWFPSVSELLKPMQMRLGERAARRNRLGQLLQIAKTPLPPKPEPYQTHNMARMVHDLEARNTPMARSLAELGRAMQKGGGK